MSAAVSTSRAASRSTRDKLSNRQTTQSTNRHNDGGGTSVPKDKYQPTQEQLNLAQITKMDDEDEKKKITQLMEMTGKNEGQVAVALLDCEDDVERAALMLLEGDDNDQGEWKSQGKKKKPKNTTPLPPPPKHDSQPNHTDKSEIKRDRSQDRDQESSDRSDGPSRRGRRNGAPPPRFARGRGRDRNMYGGERHENGDDNRENGDDNRDRSGVRGRGRGGFGRRGRGRGGRGGGSGDFGGEFNSEKSEKFEKGPQIDTWTNETAEIQQKEPAGWGSTWGAEDWNEDSWTGNLNETQVFTASTSSSLQEPQPSPVLQNDSSSSLGQRLDLGMLLQKPTDQQQQSKQSYSMSQYNQQATESIKNCIGIGAPRPQNISNLQTNQSASSLGPVGSISQSIQSNNLPSPSSQQSLQQRSAKIARSKVPPPSKIPASAVEMPGHRMPMLDVQFGVDFGNEPAALSFGAADSSVNNRLPVSNSPPMGNHVPQINSVSNATDSMTSIMASPPAASNSAVMSGLDQSASLFQISAYASPPKNESQTVHNQNKMTPPEPISFPSSDRKSSPLVSQRPTQASSNPIGQGSLSSSQDSSNLAAFAQAAGTYPSAGYQGHKSSALPGSQAYTHTTNSQNSTYQSSYQAGQNPYQSSSNQYPSTQNQYQTTSQTPYQSPSQNQYQTGQNQYQSGQTQFPSGQSGQQGYSNYQSGTSFQTQTGYSSNPSNSNSLYQNSSQGSAAYSGQSSSQGSSAYSGQSSSQGSSAYPGQNSTQGSAAYSGQSSAQNSGSFPGQSASQNSGAYSGQTSSQGNGAYAGQNSSQGSSAYTGQASSYHIRDTQSSSSNPANTNQYQTASPGLSTSPSPTAYSAPTSQAQSSFSVQQSQTQSGYNSQTAASQTSYSAQSYSSSSTLQTSPLTTSKLGDSLSKITLKDGSLDSHTTSQFDDSSTSTPSLTVTTNTPSLSGGSVITPSSTSISPALTTTSSSRISSISSNSLSTSKAPPNLPPGVSLVGTPQYIMGQAGGVPSFYSLQQPVYGYDDQMQLLPQRLPLANNYYDMSATYQVPSSLSGRDQATLANVPYSVTSDSKLNRVDAQSPNPSTQQPTSQSAHQPFIHFNYGYYYPPVLPGTAGFQIPTMFPMPAVTNTPHASTTATTQFQKTFASHGYGTKAYDDLSQVQDYSKAAYGVAPSQTKVTAGTRSAVDLAGSSYTKSHSQAFDKQGFHAGTPPPFMPHGTANQTGPMGTPSNPYAATAPYVQMMNPHSQMLHHIQQDSAVTNRMSQSSSQSKTGGSKAYSAAYWGTS